MSFANIYQNPYARVVRRFFVVGVAAAAALFVSKIQLDPAHIIPSILGLHKVDWTQIANVGAGTALLAAIDKIRREWTNLLTYEGDTNTDPLA